MRRAISTQKLAPFAFAVLLSSSVAVAQRGYIPYEGNNAVVYEGSNGQIYELYLSSTGWHLLELSLLAGAPPAFTWDPFGDALPFVRTDQINAVVYVGNNLHIYELFQLPGFSWQFEDLTNAGALEAAGNPAPYIRSDGVNSVVYKARYDTDIHEASYSPRAGRWLDRNLSSLSGAPPGRDPHPYVRSDAFNSIVYRGLNSHIYEIFLVPGGAQYGDLTDYAGAPIAGSDPHPYVRSDAVNSVVYKGYFDNHIYELFLSWDGWHYGDLTYYSGAPLPASNPHPYVRFDGFNSVVYRGLDNHIYELFLSWDGWHYGDLTYYSGAPLGDVGSTVHPYVRSDGVDSVVYSSGGRITEIYLLDGWHYGDLSAQAGG